MRKLLLCDHNTVYFSSSCIFICISKHLKAKWDVLAHTVASQWAVVCWWGSGVHAEAHSYEVAVLNLFLFEQLWEKKLAKQQSTPSVIHTTRCRVCSSLQCESQAGCTSSFPFSPSLMEHPNSLWSKLTFAVCLCILLFQFVCICRGWPQTHQYIINITALRGSNSFQPKVGTPTFSHWEYSNHGLYSIFHPSHLTFDLQTIPVHAGCFQWSRTEPQHPKQRSWTKTYFLHLLTAPRSSFWK